MRDKDSVQTSLPSKKLMHAVNNHLSVILGHAEILAHDLGAESEYQPHLHAIVKATQEVAKLIQR